MRNISNVLDVIEEQYRVEILDAATLEVLGRCPGPTPAGKCPRADRHGVVACAGCRIAPGDADPEYWLVEVPPRSRHCPLAWTLEASY